MQHTGRPGTRVIPAAWSVAPRAVFEKTRTATCTIRRPGGTKGPFNTTTGTYPITPSAPHFTGSCRIQHVAARQRTELVAEQDITIGAYQITVSIEATEVQVDDVVAVTCFDDNGDPVLENHEFIVRSVDRASLDWERVLTCTDNLG